MIGETTGPAVVETTPGTLLHHLQSLWARPGFCRGLAVLAASSVAKLWIVLRG